MVTTGNDSTEQKEQIPTSKTSVEVSQWEKEMEEVLNDSKKNQEILGVNYTARTESEELEGGVAKTTKDKAIASVEEDSQKNSQTIENEVLKNLSLAEIKNVVAKYDNEKLKVTINDLLKKYKNLSKWIKSTEWSWSTKKDLRHRLYENIKSLNKMKDDLNKINYSNLDTYKWRVWELMYYFEHYEQIRQIVVLGWRASDIHAIIDSKQDAKYAKRQEKKDAKYQSSMNDILHNAAVTWMWNDDMERYEEYLEAVLNWQVEPSSHPFYTKHMQSFAMIQATNPALYWELVPKNRKWQIFYSTYCQRDPARYEAFCRNNNIICRPKTFNGKFWEWLADMVEYFGLNKEKDPRKRQAWQNAWSVLALGWSAVLWFMFLKNLFSSRKENKNKWWKVAWRWAGLLALTNRDKVTKWVEDISWWHPAEKTRMLAESFKTYWFSDTHAIEIANRYVWAPVATISALHFIPMYELESQHILENKNGEFEFNYNNYKKYINEFAWDKDQKEIALKAWEKLDNDKSIWAWLKAFGITTREKFKSLFWSDKKKTLADTDEVKNEWAKMSERVWNKVNAELFKNWFRATSPESVDKIIEEYEKEKNIWEEKLNELILKWMKEWLLEFTDEKEYTIDEMINGPYKDLIDLDNMTMKWFRYSEWANEVKFSTYEELFEVVYVTDWIKKNYKSRATAKDENPFHINAIWGLDFNDTEWYDFHRWDSTVISLKEFKNIPTIKNKGDVRDAYVKYLNDWRIKSLWK